MKHLTLADISPDNLRYYVEKPDKNFSVKRNYAIINQVIEENDKMQRQLNRKVQENAGNAADILASFAKYKLDIGGGKKLEQWLGKEWMKRIYGERLMDKIRMLEIIKAQNRAKGNTKFENFYLT